MKQDLLVPKNSNILKERKGSFCPVEQHGMFLSAVISLLPGDHGSGLSLGLDWVRGRWQLQPQALRAVSQGGEHMDLTRQVSGLTGLLTSVLTQYLNVGDLPVFGSLSI